VHAAAAEVGPWMRLLPNDAGLEHRLGLAASRLPSVVFWYRQGLSPEEIGRRLTPFGCGCYGDRAIAAACALIATLLNSGWARAGTRTPNHGRRSWNSGATSTRWSSPRHHARCRRASCAGALHA